MSREETDDIRKPPREKEYLKIFELTKINSKTKSIQNFVKNNLKKKSKKKKLKKEKKTAEELEKLWCLDSRRRFFLSSSRSKIERCNLWMTHVS